MNAVHQPRAGESGARQNWAGAMLRAMRPKQWTKSAFVVPALLFSHSLFDPSRLVTTLQVICAFCLLSSSVYLINDVADRDKDKQHPVKRNRPIAAGRVSVSQAMSAAGALALGSLAWSFTIGPWVGLISVIYLVQSVLYSFWLKHVVLVDIFVLALGFVLRVLVGGAAISVAISPWLLVTTILLALFIGLSKRRHEIALLGTSSTHREILAEYPLVLVDQLIAIVTSATIVVYTLYSFQSSHDGRLIYTVPFVLFGIFRYLYLLYRQNGGGEPETLVLSDVPLLVDMSLWAVTTFVILYALPA